MRKEMNRLALCLCALVFTLISLSCGGSSENGTDKGTSYDTIQAVLICDGDIYNPEIEEDDDVPCQIDPTTIQESDEEEIGSENNEPLNFEFVQGVSPGYLFDNQLITDPEIIYDKYQQIAADIYENSGNDNQLIDEQESNAKVVKIKLPKSYTAVFTYHNGFLGSCIKRNVPHVGFLISKAGKSKPVADIHIAAWRNGKKPCFAVYLSDPKKWCFNTCNYSYKKFVENIAKALVVAGISVTTAYILAQVLAPIAIAALALP